MKIICINNTQLRRRRENLPEYIGIINLFTNLNLLRRNYAILAPFPLSLLSLPYLFFYRISEVNKLGSLTQRRIARVGLAYIIIAGSRDRFHGQH